MKKKSIILLLVLALFIYLVSFKDILAQTCVDGNVICEQGEPCCKKFNPICDNGKAKCCKGKKDGGGLKCEDKQGNSFIVECKPSCDTKNTNETEDSEVENFEGREQVAFPASNQKTQSQGTNINTAGGRSKECGAADPADCNNQNGGTTTGGPSGGGNCGKSCGGLHFTLGSGGGDVKGQCADKCVDDLIKPASQGCGNSQSSSSNTNSQGSTGRSIGIGGGSFTLTGPFSVQVGLNPSDCSVLSIHDPTNQLGYGSGDFVVCNSPFCLCKTECNEAQQQCNGGSGSSATVSLGSSFELGQGDNLTFSSNASGATLTINGNNVPATTDFYINGGLCHVQTWDLSGHFGSGGMNPKNFPGSPPSNNPPPGMPPKGNFPPNHPSINPPNPPWYGVPGKPIPPGGLPVIKM